MRTLKTFVAAIGIILIAQGDLRAESPDEAKIIHQGAAAKGVSVETPRSLDATDSPTSRRFCADMCGNGGCEEIVCMAEGCPCSESAESCPDDCKEG